MPHVYSCILQVRPQKILISRCVYEKKQYETNNMPSPSVVGYDCYLPTSQVLYLAVLGKDQPNPLEGVINDLIQSERQFERFLLPVKHTLVYIKKK